MHDLWLDFLMENYNPKSKIVWIFFFFFRQKNDEKIYLCKPTIKNVYSIYPLFHFDPQPPSFRPSWNKVSWGYNHTELTLVQCTNLIVKPAEIQVTMLYFVQYTNTYTDTVAINVTINMASCARIMPWSLQRHVRKFNYTLFLLMSFLEFLQR